MHAKIPLVVEFAPGSRVEPWTGLPKDAIVRFSDGREIPVPADQIVLEEQEEGAARVGFGGVTFEGIVDGQLAFWRVKDIAPEETLSADREIRFLIAPELVSSIHAHGTLVWPKSSGLTS